jgi:hypothetical protein
MEAGMDRSDASALADLQMHWDEAYVIGLDGNIWSARYHNSADELRAHTSAELRDLIRSDYAYRQRTNLVTRDRDDTDDGDSGDRDSGDRDSGDRDSGDRDSGDRDSGDDAEVAMTASAEQTLAAEATAAARGYAAEIDFAVIRGERMST